MSKPALHRALIDSAKSDIAESRATEDRQGRPFTADAFFDGLDEDELFGDPLDVSVERCDERST